MSNIRITFCHDCNGEGSDDLGPCRLCNGTGCTTVRVRALQWAPLKDMEEREELLLFGAAFMGWVDAGFEAGYDAHFYNGLVLGNAETKDAAKRLCEHHVRKAFRLESTP